MHFIALVITLLTAYSVRALPQQEGYYAISQQVQPQYDQQGQPQYDQQGQPYYNQQGQPQYDQQGQPYYNQQGQPSYERQQPETTNAEYQYRCSGRESLPYCCWLDSNKMAQCQTYGGSCTTGMTEICCPGRPSSTLACAAYYDLLDISQY